IKHAKPEASLKESLHRAVDLCFSNQSLFHGTDESLVRVTTLEICTALHRQRRSFFRGFSKLVAPVDINARTAVGNYVALTAPFTAQDVVQQMCVRATRFSVRSVIRTHSRRSVRLRDGGLKGG